MKHKNHRSLKRSILRAAVFTLAAAGLSINSARASSYACNLTNVNGTVSFRLNDSADNVKVIGNAGSLTNDLGALPSGLTVTNLNTFSGMTGGVFQVVVAKIGSGQPSLIGSSVAFNAPRGVSVNVRPGSPYFGRVYVANTTAGTKGDGLFIFGSDLSDTFGQGATAKTGGITNFGTGTTSSPYRVKVGHDDDMLYVTDWSDASGNLYVVDPDITNSAVTSYALKQLTGTAAVPVGAANNHGSVAAVEVLGSLGGNNLKIFTIDEDYKTDPTAPGQTEDNSLWEYDVSGGPLPWGNPPDAKRLTPTINFTSQTMNLGYSAASGYFYVAENRSAGNEAGIFVVDSSGTLLFNSRTESIAEGFSVDVLKDICAAAVTQDGKYLATLGFGGTSGNANVVTIVPLTNGIPNLPARFQYTGFGTTASGRDMAFDAADNLYVVSSGLAILQALSLGFTATNTTSSDGNFSSATPSTQVSAYLLDPNSTVTNTLSEADTSTFATFNIVRTNDDMSGPITINFSVTGTATRGTQVTNDYSIRTNGVVLTNISSVVIPAGKSNVLVDIVANDDTVPELTETILFNLSGGAYSAAPPLGGTIAIVDNDMSMIDISSIVFTNAYEGNTNDFIRYRFTRRGDTNAASFSVNVLCTGSAVSNVDYTVGTLTIDPGVLTQDFDIHPINDSIIETNETVILSVASGNNYLVGTNNTVTTGATGIIIDDDQPAETVVFSDNFDTDTTANWIQLFAGETNHTYDASVIFNYDYSQLSIPSAPHSTGGDTHGLFMTVNKNNSFQAAGLNLYPIGQNFTGNYALRFDMFLILGSGSFTTEYALCGINHSGTQTNWFRNSGAGVVGGYNFDGVWAYIEADGAALGDYILNSGPAVTNAGVVDPTTLASQTAVNMARIFHTPPWAPGAGAGGAPSNLQATTTPVWAQVELSQIGKIVTLKIDNAVILSYSNTTPYTAGNVMLGYDDAFDSQGPADAAVVYDNVRVVSLPPGLHIDQIQAIGGNAQIDFSWFENDPANAFKLQLATNVVGPYVDDTNTATAYSVVSPASSYRIVTPRTTATRFYRVRHL